MTVPTPVPLDQPAGSPEAVLDAAGDARAAAALLDELADRVGAARMPTWHGADAAAVADRCAATARLAAETADALHRADARLSAHAELWSGVRVRIEALRAAQDDDFARARVRVAVPHDPADPLAPRVDDLLDHLAAAEADRRAQHAGLVARLADDADETRGVLTGCLTAVGATGGSGTVGALAYLADQLPGWGRPELAHRARGLARLLLGEGEEEGTSKDDGSLTPEEADALAGADLDLAQDPAYAAAFLTALGPDGTALVLASTWSGTWTETRVDDLMGAALSSLDRDATGPPWLASLLDDARPAGVFAPVAGGLAAALASARRSGRDGPPAALAAAWAGTLLTVEREEELVDLGVPPQDADPLTTDPLALVLDALVRQGAAAETGALMRSPDAWTSLLGRTWNDGGGLADRVVATVADAPDDVAAPALRSALLAIGGGLEDADPVDWPLDVELLVGVAPALATALARHAGTVTAGLEAAATGAANPTSVTALRGLAVLVNLDGTAATTVRAAVSGLALAPAALVAVKEHGSQLLEAMEQHRRKRTAEGRAEAWDWTFGMGFTAVGVAPGVGWASGVVEAGVRDVLGVDGQLAVGPEPEAELTGADAVAGLGAVGLAGGRDRQAVAEAASRAFGGAWDLLGDPERPESTDRSFGCDVAEAAVGELVGGGVARRIKRGLLGEGAGEVAGDEAQDLVDCD